MKKIYLLLTIGILLSSCDKQSTMKPDELGNSVFKIFQTDDVESLKNLCITVKESLDAFDKSERKFELSEEQNKEIDKLKNDEKYREEIDSENYKRIAKDFIRAREKLIKKLKTDITTYKILDVYVEMEKVQGQNYGRVILEIKNDTNDKNYVGFELTEVSPDNWKLYDDIWIPSSISKEYVKYKYIDILAKN